MIQCLKCGSRCDPSDIERGICDDCRDQAERTEEKKREIAQQMKDDKYGKMQLCVVRQ